MNPRFSTIAVLATALLTGTASAQITKPPLSPRSVVDQEIGLGKIKIDYGRPSVRGREIFGKLEAYGLVWRTGANGCTKLTFSEDAKVGGKSIEAGTYGLFTIPEKKSWTVIISRQADLWGAGGYDPAKDAARIEVKPSTLPTVQETLSIGFDGFHANGADLVIAWEKVEVRVPVEVDSDARVLAEIDEKVRNAKGDVDARTYFDAGMYLYERRSNLDEAEAWIDRSVELRPDAWWQSYYRAELALHLGKHKKAMEAAKAALEGAEGSPRGDFGYAARTRELMAKIEKESAGG